MTDAIIMTIEAVRTRASTQEALLTLAVPIEDGQKLSAFMAKIGRQVGVAFAEVDQQPMRSKGDYSHEAEKLWQSGFFRAPDVWKAAGTDAEYIEWCQRQKSAFSGLFSEYVNGEGRCIAAHVRRVANGAGSSIKPPYSTIPLTNDEHTNSQHQKGESSMGGKEWFDKKRIEYLERWASERIKAQIDVDHWYNCPPDKLFVWAQQNEVDQYLPLLYKRA